MTAALSSHISIESDPAKYAVLSRIDTPNENADLYDCHEIADIFRPNIRDK